MQAGTKVIVVDNTGVVKARCIKVLGVGKKLKASMSNKVLVVVTNVLLNKKIQVPKGQICRAIVVRAKIWLRRRYQYGRLRFFENSVVLVNKRWSPIGRRIKGPVPKEVGWDFVYVGSINTGLV